MLIVSHSAAATGRYSPRPPPPAWFPISLYILAHPSELLFRTWGSREAGRCITLSNPQQCSHIVCRCLFFQCLVYPTVMVLWDASERGNPRLHSINVREQEPTTCSVRCHVLVVEQA